MTQGSFCDIVALYVVKRLLWVDSFGPEYLWWGAIPNFNWLQSWQKPCDVRANKSTSSLLKFVRNAIKWTWCFGCYAVTIVHCGSQACTKIESRTSQRKHDRQHVRVLLCLLPVRVGFLLPYVTLLHRLHQILIFEVYTWSIHDCDGISYLGLAIKCQTESMEMANESNHQLV